MIYTRREMGKLALAAIPMARLAAAAEKPNSVFNGVWIGAITFSWRAMPSSAEQILKYCVDSGISGVEMMNSPAEEYAGAPAGGGRGPAPVAPGGRAPAAPEGAPRGRAPLTPEQQAAQRKAAEEMKQWRLSVSMDRYKALRALYNQAGVSIYAFKLGLNLAMSDAEYDYLFNVGKALGCSHVTMELPTDPELTKRVGECATKHQMFVGYHAHTQATDFLWDAALSQSKYNGINFDIGHYVSGTSQSPIPFIQKHYDRIVSLHLKDRKKDNGPNVPWGQGDTPIGEALQLMRKEKYKFPASIELEYDVPQGSTAGIEVKKCLAYCKGALV